MDKISVIIPIYNSSNYLHQCIDSVLKQHYEDFEVLLINDGSKDNSGIICDEYAAKDTRIRVFHKQNGGVSSARNLGLDYAKGTWITFIDSDDFIEQNFFDSVNIITLIADVIFTGIDKYYDNQRTSSLRFENKTLVIEDFFENYFLFPHFAGPVGKFFKKQIIEKHHIRFDERLQNGEDGLFNFHYLVKIQYVTLESTPIYIYQNRDNSLSKREIPVEDAELLYQSLLQVMENNGFKEEIISRNLSYVISIFFFAILKSKYDFKTKTTMITNLSNRFKSRVIRHLQGSQYTRVLGFLVKYNQYKLIVAVANFRILLFKGS